jgi:uncharacterized membrane protein YbhN (UPF0104 family)
VSHGFSKAANDAPAGLFRLWRIVLALAVIALAAGYLWNSRETLLAYLSTFNPSYAPWLILTAIASIAVNGIIMSDLVRQFGVRLHPLECFGLTAAGSLANYLPVPQANGIVRGLYLKSRHMMPYDSFVSTVMVTNMMALPAIGILGLSSLAVTAFNGLAAPWPLWLLFTALTTSCLLFGPAIGLLRPFKKFAGFKDSISMLMQKHILGRMAALQVIQLMLTGVALWLSFRALGNRVSWNGSLTLGLLANTAGVANVTPGNIGLIESATALGAYFLQGDTHLTVVAYSVYRVASILALAVTSGAFALLWKKGNAG